MVSIRRFIISKLWSVRRSKFMLVLFTVILTLAVRILLQAGVRLLEEPSHSLADDAFHDGYSDRLVKKGQSQKNYKLTWLNQDDSHVKGTDGKQRFYHKENTNNNDELSITNDHHYNQNTSMQTKRRFIFAFRYYEQLGRATSNLLALASWAKYRNSLFVAPFVNNSRMSGLPGGVSHFLRETTKLKFGSLSTYYDLEMFNETLNKRSYGTLATLNEFENECHHRLNIVVHFLYSDLVALKDAAEWYRKSYKEMRTIYSKAQSNGGWLPCPFVRHSRLQKQLRFKVSRFVCVDPDIIRSPEELEEKVLQGRQCVGVVFWKGNGKFRTHFPIHPSISHPLVPSDVPFNQTLVKIAQNFVREKIGSKFIAIHVRIERHFDRLGINVTYRCMKKLIRRVNEARKRFGLGKLFLASDLPIYGSDTFKGQKSALKDREMLLEYLLKHLDYPITYKPTGIYDTGSIAIIEMNIMAAGKKLYTLGGGNFQEWILNLFLKKPTSSRHDLHRLCELT